jgi:hypothetical protein
MHPHKTCQVAFCAHRFVDTVWDLAGFVPFADKGLDFVGDPFADFGAEVGVGFVEVGGVVLFGTSGLGCAVKEGRGRGRGRGGKDIHPDTNSDPQKESSPQKNPASLSPPPHFSAPEPQLHSPPLVSLPSQEVLQVEWEGRRLSWCPESRLGVSLCIS